MQETHDKHFVILVCLLSTSNHFCSLSEGGSIKPATGVWKMEGCLSQPISPVQTCNLNAKQQFIWLIPSGRGSYYARRHFQGLGAAFTVHHHQHQGVGPIVLLPLQMFQRMLPLVYVFGPSTKLSLQQVFYF